MADRHRCSRTIVAARVFEKFPDDSRPQLEEFEGTLVSADDTPIRVYGQAEMNIQIGGTWYW